MYTDPGSGLFFAQILVAAVATAAYRFRRLIASVFTRGSRADDKETQ
jgi:hypothetical protein